MLNPDPVNLASFVDARSLHVYGASPARLGGPSLALKRAVKPVGSVAEGLSQLGGGGDGEALGGGGDGEALGGGGDGEALGGGGDGEALGGGGDGEALGGGGGGEAGGGAESQSALW